MLDTIWSTIMQLVYQRYHAPQQNSILCNVPYTKFQERLKESCRYQVFQSSTRVCQVQIPDTGIKYIVNLEEKYCSCYNFFQYRGPCTHAIAACCYKAEDPFDYFDSVYYVRKFRETYKVPITPISIENLSVEEGMQPPKIVKKRGRPQTKRIRKNSWKRKQQKYSNCFGLGHNKRRCTNQPGRKNGRGERARDWVLDSSLSSRSILLLSTISAPSSLSSLVVRMLDTLSSEEASSQANSTDSGESTNDSEGEATGMKRRRPAAPTRAMPARQRRKPARYQEVE
jgi:predicted nucleic acid-binding Zn finger protein